MSRDPDQIYSDRQRQNRAAQQREMRGTMESYQLEKQEANSNPWPKYIVNALAFVGLIAIFYVIFQVLF